MAPDPDAGQGVRDGLLFRFGFIAHRAGEQPRGDSTWERVAGSWRSLEVAGMAIRHHPETPVRCRWRDGAAAVLIGDAFAVPRERTVESALDELLAAGSDERLFEGLDALSGRFALLLLGASPERALHDPIGSRSLFYRLRGDLCVASHAELIARAYELPESAPARELIATEEYLGRSVKYLPGDLTLYEDVHALTPNNYYDMTAGRTVRYWPRRRPRPTGFEDFFAALDEHFAALASHLQANHSPVVGVTGGVDSRTLIAALADRGLPLMGATWVRENGVPGAKEREVIDAIVARKGIEHAYLAVDPLAGELREVAAAARRNVGNFWRRSRVTAHMYERFSRIGSVFVGGHGPEIARGFYNLAERGLRATRGKPRGMRLEALARTILLRGPRPRRARIDALTPSALLGAYGSSMSTRPGERYARLGGEAFEGFMERANFDQRLIELGLDPNDLFYWEHRMGIWGSAKHNEMDPALLSITAFSSRPVYESALGMDPQERLTKQLQLAAVRRYDPRLAELPYL